MSLGVSAVGIFVLKKTTTKITSQFTNPTTKLLDQLHSNEIAFFAPLERGCKLCFCAQMQETWKMSQRVLFVAAVSRRAENLFENAAEPFGMD